VHLRKWAVVAFEAIHLKPFRLRADQFIRREQMPHRGRIGAAGISGSVRNTATLLEVLVATKITPLSGLDPASA